MRIVKGLVWLVIILLVGVVAVGLVLPDQKRVVRTIWIGVQPSTVFTVLNGYRNFNEWSPWASLDPNTAYAYSGPVQGVGASMNWVSNDAQVGTGDQQIVESKPWTLIRAHLNFGDSSADNWSEFDLQPERDGTRLNWTIESDFGANLLDRYFGLLLDSMIGDDLDRGLVNLKTYIETLPKTDFSDLDPQLLDLPAQPLVMQHGQVAGGQSPEQALSDAYATIMSFVSDQGLEPAGLPLAFTRSYNEKTGAWVFDAALPLKTPCTAPPSTSVVCGESPATKVIRVEHVGPYESLAPTYHALLAYREAVGYHDDGDSWEEFVSDPQQVAPEKLVTRIYWPVK